MNVCVPTYLQQDAAAAAFEDFNLPKKTDNNKFSCWTDIRIDSDIGLLA
jgi:hypothetical protein